MSVTFRSISFLLARFNFFGEKKNNNKKKKNEKNEKKKRKEKVEKKIGTLPAND